MHAIDQLKELNLSEYPIAELDRLLTNLEPLGIMLTNYHKNTCPGNILRK